MTHPTSSITTKMIWKKCHVCHGFIMGFRTEVTSDSNICLLFFLLNSMRISYPDGASVSKKINPNSRCRYSHHGSCYSGKSYVAKRWILTWHFKCDTCNSQTIKRYASEEMYKEHCFLFVSAFVGQMTPVLCDYHKHIEKEYWTSFRRDNSHLR